jgi:hypothetical protein
VLRRKYFWITLFIVFLFVAIWLTEGFGFAIILTIIVLLLIALIGSGTRRRKRRYYREDDEEEIIERRPVRRNTTYIADDTPIYHQERQCPVCDGSGKVKWGSEASGMPLITRGAPGASKYVRCPRCRGNGRI